MVGNELIELQEKLSHSEEFNKDLIFRTILDLVIEISPLKIDFEGSELIITESYNLKLVSLDSNNCTLYIEVLEDLIVDVQLNKGGEYLYMQPIRNWNDLHKLKSAIKDILYYEIEEELIYCQNKLINVSYYVNQEVDNKILKYPYKSSFGFCFFWQKKQINKKVYDPWIG